MSASAGDSKHEPKNEAKGDSKSDGKSPSLVKLGAGEGAGLHIGKQANRLAKEKSPYLLQHKYNPVDWFAWNEEARAEAKRRNMPIFLSVGYSTCHWCHVMEHESFENEQIAEIMNENFINIKVDREERPDVDKIYMAYIQATSGGGGWPMSVFLTPDLKPIMGGTYFPPRDQYGRPGFPTVLQKIAAVWKQRPKFVEESSERIVKALREQVLDVKPSSATNTDTIAKVTFPTGFDQFDARFDEEFGGFDDHPKFPRPVVFEFMFRVYDRALTEVKVHDDDKARGQRALEETLITLREMAKGGMHDHLAGGFHRYSTTRDWHIPHYEKMTYDQGQLAVSYLEAFQITRDEAYASVARGILEYMSGPIMCHPEGGFFSAEDADSWPPPSRKVIKVKEKKLEGAFYVWERKEIHEILKDKAELFDYVYDIRDEGNAPPEADPHHELAMQNTLTMRHTAAEAAKKFNLSVEDVQKQLAESRRALLAVRDKRPRPHLDDKIITAWNGLMLQAFAKAYQILGDEKYLAVAVKAATFIKKNLTTNEGKKLLRSYREGPSNIAGFSDDYAYLIAGLLDLYEASLDVAWLQWAVQLQRTHNELFADATHGGFFDVEAGDKSLLFRTKEDYDGSEPSNQSVAALNLLRLSHMVNRKEWLQQAEKLILAFEEKLVKRTIGVPLMAVAADLLLRPPKQVVICGDRDAKDTRALLQAVHSKFVPNKIVLLLDKSSREFLGKENDFLAGLEAKGGKATAYVCRHFACNLPTTDPEEVAKQM